MTQEQLAELLLALKQWGRHYRVKGAPVSLTLLQAHAVLLDLIRKQLAAESGEEK